VSSTLTGNYDVCIETTEALLTVSAASIFPVGHVQKFPFSQPFKGSTFTGTAKLFIDDIEVNIDPSRSPYVLMTVRFVDSAFDLTAPGIGYAAPLAGNFVVSVPCKLSPSSASAAQSASGVTTPTKPPAPTALPASPKLACNVELDFTDPSVIGTVTLDAPSLEDVTNALAIVPSEVPQFLNDALLGALASNPGKVDLTGDSSGVSLAWALPGRNGSLGSPLQFADMALQTRPAGGGKPGVLSILGTVLVADIPDDDVAAKTATATDASHQASFTLSPDAFNGLFVVLPPSQTTGGVTVTVTSLAGYFEEGQIDLVLANGDIPLESITYRRAGVEHFPSLRMFSKGSLSVGSSRSEAGASRASPHPGPLPLGRLTRYRTRRHPCDLPTDPSAPFFRSLRSPRHPLRGPIDDRGRPRVDRAVLPGRIFASSGDPA
jgi:hypothetical protein